MNNQELKNVVEALLMNSSEPLDINKIRSVFDDWQQPTTDQIKKVLEELKIDYNERAIELKCLASGYCFQTKDTYAEWISRMHSEKPTKYSSAFLETLAIIAYRQPVTRAEIESIRGVAVSSSIIKTMVERGWIKVSGNRDLPGKPAVYVTTKSFLDYFNLKNLEDLPQLPASAENA